MKVLRHSSEKNHLIRGMRCTNLKIGNFTLYTLLFAKKIFLGYIYIFVNVN